jgi:hypothetical protein
MIFSGAPLDRILGATVLVNVGGEFTFNIKAIFFKGNLLKLLERRLRLVLSVLGLPVP